VRRPHDRSPPVWRSLVGRRMRGPGKFAYYVMSAQRDEVVVWLRVTLSANAGGPTISMLRAWPRSLGSVLPGERLDSGGSQGAPVSVTLEAAGRQP
jgi:hypothetical protein